MHQLERTMECLPLHWYFVGSCGWRFESRVCPGLPLLDKTSCYSTAPEVTVVWTAAMCLFPNLYPFSVHTEGYLFILNISSFAVSGPPQTHLSNSAALNVFRLFILPHLASKALDAMRKIPESMLSWRITLKRCCNYITKHAKTQRCSSLLQPAQLIPLYRKPRS